MTGQRVCLGCATVVQELAGLGCDSFFFRIDRVNSFFYIDSDNVYQFQFIPTRKSVFLITSAVQGSV